MPDPDISWARATVVHAWGRSKFEVNVEATQDSGLKPRAVGFVEVDVAAPGFEGMSSLPLQV